MARAPNKLSPFNVVSLALGLAFLYLPIVILVTYSFNASRLVTVWGGWSLRWYTEFFNDRAMLEAAWMSFRVATVSATSATVLGTLAAIALSRGRGYGEGLDELGVLLMGHGLNGWWTGSQLDIHETRRLVPGQNATTLQVAAAVLGGLVWMIRNPGRGILVPDELNFREILEVAGPYLGPCPSVQTDWTPLKSRSRLFGKWGTPAVTDADLWQFASFAVTP
jgi:hypothetical protein